MWRNGIRASIRECFGGTWVFWKDIPCSSSSFFFSFLKKEKKWLVFRGPLQNMHKYIRTGLKIRVLTMVSEGSGGGWGLTATTVFQGLICHSTSTVKHGSLHSGSRARAAISTLSPAHPSTMWQVGQMSFKAPSRSMFKSGVFQNEKRYQGYPQWLSATPTHSTKWQWLTCALSNSYDPSERMQNVSFERYYVVTFL